MQKQTLYGEDFCLSVLGWGSVGLLLGKKVVRSQRDHRRGTCMCRGVCRGVCIVWLCCGCAVNDSIAYWVHVHNVYSSVPLVHSSYPTKHILSLQGPSGSQPRNGSTGHTSSSGFHRLKDIPPRFQTHNNKSSKHKYSISRTATGIFVHLYTIIIMCSYIHVHVYLMAVK